MAKELPYFKYFPSEWVTGDITLCSMEAQGLFMNLCSYYWMKNCSMSLANAKQRFSNYETALKELLKFEIIKIDESENILINFLDEQMNEFINVSEKRAIAGARGGTAKAKQLPKFALAKCNNKEKEKEKEKEKDKEYKKSLLSEIKISDFPNLKSDYIEISKAFQELFIQIMKENDVNPNMIKNAKGGWIDSVRLMIEQDKYTIENLREVFKYLQEEKVGKDGFAWRNVIQSTSKLREKMSKIQTSIKNEKNKSNNKGATYEEIADLLTSDPRFASLPDR
jgi:ribosomal protein L12E/L44/L45/RPP1/RPP2